MTLFKLIALNKCLKIVVIQIQWHFTYQLTFQCSLIDIVRIFRSEYWERYLYPLCRRKDSKWGEIPTHTPTPRMWKLLPVSEIQLKKKPLLMKKKSSLAWPLCWWWVPLSQSRPLSSPPSSWSSHWQQHYCQHTATRPPVRPYQGCWNPEKSGQSKNEKSQVDKKKSGRTRGVETNNSNKHQSTTINCNKYSEQIIKYQIPQGWIFVHKNMKLSIPQSGVFWNCLSCSTRKS